MDFQPIKRQLTEGYMHHHKLYEYNQQQMISIQEVIDVAEHIRQLIFPSLYGLEVQDLEIEIILKNIHNTLNHIIEHAMCMTHQNVSQNQVQELVYEIIQSIPHLQELCLKDVYVAFDSDPAAKSYQEIILTYPGIYAISYYRLAHLFYKLNIPIIPRILSEHAHNVTGIDIHPGAEIDHSFFIDHGTGIVIGETAIIGYHVKLYQGVTLGTLSTKKGQLLKNVKRHPTIKDHVTIYANATVLGGNTIIGNHVIIGANVFLTHSVDDYAKVTLPKGEMTISYPK